MKKQFLNPSTHSKPLGYTHVISVEGAGKLIFVSGQVAWDSQGNLVGQGDLAAQANKASENLVAALAAAGATPADIVKINTYVVNYKESDRTVIREARQRYFPTDNPPASTLVGVTALAVAGLLVEIEAVAVVR